jgi:hypothetical protein
MQPGHWGAPYFKGHNIGCGTTPCQKVVVPEGARITGF